MVYDEAIYKRLRERDVDEKLARHIAHLFIRDPLVIFKELLDLDDTQSSDHFEVRNQNYRSIKKKKLNCLFLELAIYKLANNEIQASTTKL